MIVQRCKTLLVPHIFKKPSNHNLLQINHSCYGFSLFFSTRQPSIDPEISSSSSLVDFFLQKHQFSQKTATKAANALAHFKKPENFDSVLLFLKKNGFSNTQLENILSNRLGPRLLCSSVDRNLEPKINIFRNVGFSDSDMACIISSDPWLLMHSGDNRILPSILVLKDMLGSVSRVAKLLKVSAWFFRYDLERILLPNIEFLKSCGIGMDQLIHHIFLSPRAFLHGPDKLKKIVQKVDEMGFDKESKLYIYAITTVSRMSEETWKKKLELLTSLGFSEGEILQMLRRRPQFIAVSESKIEEVMRVLFDLGKYEMSDIVSHPGVFMTSIENRLKPRLQVLKILSDLNLIEKWPVFSAVYLVTDKIFTKRFLAPHLDALGDSNLAVNKLLKEVHSDNISAVQS